MFFGLKLKNIALCLLGSAILAFGLYNVHALSGVTEGGILGLTLLLNHWFHLSPALSGFVMNFLCYAMGWRTLGNKFIGYSMVAGGGFSLFYWIFEQFPPLWPALARMQLPAAIVGALFVGVGIGISVRAGGAPGGDDAMAMSLSKLLKIDIRWVYLAQDLIVLLLSLTYLNVTHIAVSLLTVVLSGQMIGIVQKFHLPKNG